MAKKKSRRKKRTLKKKTTKKTARTSAASSSPKLPYCTAPAALRRFLAEVPNKPIPQKVNNDLLSAWNLGGHNANSIIRVLKAISLVSGSNDPTPEYQAFMHQGSGPVRLAQLIRSKYAPLFQSHHLPHKEPDTTLHRLFNIHSGGAAGTVNYQIATFKALCDYADFETDSAVASPESSASDATAASSSAATGSQLASGPGIHIDLHIHLPENKTSRDYERIFEDIARHIYGQAGSGDD